MATECGKFVTKRDNKKLDRYCQKARDTAEEPFALRGQSVRYSDLWGAHPANALDPSEAIEAGLLDAAKRERLEG